MQAYIRLQSPKIIQIGHLYQLVDVTTATENKPDMSIVPIFNDYPDVFSEDLLGLPHDREIEFEINPKPEVVPLSKSLYQMAPVEHKEFKAQFQELLECTCVVRKKGIQIFNIIYRL